MRQWSAVILAGLTDAQPFEYSAKQTGRKQSSTSSCSECVTISKQQKAPWLVVPKADITFSAEMVLQTDNAPGAASIDLLVNLTWF